MTRSLYKLITAIIIIWIAVLIFQKEILSFLASWGPSWIKDFLIQAVDFLVHWGNLAWDWIKSLLKWFVDAASRVVAGADPFYGLAKWLGHVLSGILNWIINLFSPIFGKFSGK